MIKIEDVFVVFYAGTPLERVALRGVNFTVNSGELVSVLGNNGSGRTTLLKFLAGHVAVNFGRLWVDGKDVTSQTLNERSKLFSSVFFDHNVCTAGSLTVLENLVMASLHHQSKSFIRPAINSTIEDQYYDLLKNVNFLEMEKLLHEQVCNIPKPYKQVLALLIAVIKGAKVVLIDEHSTGLDVDASKALLEATYKIVKSKKITTIMAINDPKFALSRSDHAIVLNYGQVVADLAGEEKNHTKLEDLFMSFGKMPKIFNKKPPVNI